MGIYNSKEFKELQAEWNKKLEQSGHKEIEDYDHPDVPLKRWDSLKLKRWHPDVFLAKQTYYSKAQEMVDTFPFESELDKTVWHMHSEGYVAREIAEILGTHTQLTIHRKIKRIAKLGGLIE